MQNQKGLTLIELLTALTLSLFLIAGLFQLVVSSRSTFSMETALAGIQESGRFALHYMAQDIRLVGYQGCADPDSVNPSVIALGAPTNDFRGDAIKGYEVTNNFNPAIGADIADLQVVALAGSDVLTLRHASTTGTALSTVMTAVSDDIQVDANPDGIAAGDFVLVGDCNSNDLIKVTSISPSGDDFILTHSAVDNTSANLSKSYSTNARVMKLESNTYYVQDTGRDSDEGRDIFALFQQNSLGNRVELLEGVENLQILYGEELGNGNVRYVTADTAGLDMANVKSLRIGLLLSSREQVLPENDTREYNVLDQAISPAGTVGATSTYDNNRSIRRVFSTMVMLKNRDD